MSLTPLSSIELFQYNNVPTTPRTRKLGDLLQTLLGYNVPVRFFDESELQYIYVSPTGNDTTGDGLTPVTAYATPTRALKDLPTGWTADVWIQCAAGTYAGAQAWVLDVLPGARTTVTAYASTGRVAIVGDLTPVQALTGGNAGSAVAGKTAQVSFNVGAYGATVTAGSHYVKETTGTGTNGFYFAANAVRASTTPNLVAVSTSTAAFTAPQLMTWTTIFSGAVTIVPPSWNTNADLPWFEVQGIQFGAAANARETTFRYCKFAIGVAHVSTANIACTCVSGTQTRSEVLGGPPSAIVGCLFVAGSVLLSGPASAISGNVFAGAPSISAHLQMGGNSATVTSTAPGAQVASFTQNDFEGTGDAIWARGATYLCCDGTSTASFAMSNGRPILLYGDSHADGTLSWTGTGGLSASIVSGSSLDSAGGYLVTNSVSAGQDVTVGELAVQAVATRPTTSPVQLCRYT